MDERRRFLRRNVSDEVAVMPTTTRVRIIDISVAGVLLQTTRRVEPGVRGRLRFTLGGSPFAADVQVRRVAPPPAGSGYRLGAMFVGMTLEHRQMLDRFIANA
jgi:hypothetical protein